MGERQLQSPMKLERREGRINASNVFSLTPCLCDYHAVINRLRRPWRRQVGGTTIIQIRNQSAPCPAAQDQDQDAWSWSWSWWFWSQARDQILVALRLA